MTVEEKLASAMDEALKISDDLFQLIKNYKKVVMEKFLGIEVNTGIVQAYESGLSSSRWKSVPLQDVVTPDGIVQGPHSESVYKDSYSEAGCPLILPEHVKSLRFQPEDVRFIVSDALSDLSGYTAQGGDIIMLGQGFDTGASALIPFTYGNSMLGPGIIRIRPQSDLCDTFYMANILHFYYNTGIMKKLKEEGGITIPKMSELLLPLPPLEKQKQIAGSMLQLSAGMGMQETYHKEMSGFGELLRNLAGP